MDCSTSGISEERVPVAYGALADQYISLFGSIDRVNPDDVAMLSRHLTSLRGPVVDAGCGPGHVTAHLAALGVDVRGIDVCREFIAHARETYPQVGFEIGSLRSLPAPDESLAGILAWYSLIHIDPAEIPAVLEEFHRALMPGGVLVLGFFDGDKIEPFDHKVTTAYFWPVDGMAAVVAQRGFVVQETTTRSAPGARPHAAVVARTI